MYRGVSNLKSFFSLKAKLTAIMIGLALVPLIVVVYIAVRNAEDALEREAFNKLIALRDTRKAQIEAYFKERLRDVRTLAADRTTIQALKDFGKAFMSQGAPSVRSAYVGKPEVVDVGDGKPYSRFHSIYHPFFTHYVKERGYSDLLLINENGGIIYTVYKRSDFGRTLKPNELSGKGGRYVKTSLEKAFRKALRLSKESAVFEDFQYYEPSKEPTAFLASPVYDRGKVIGVLVFCLSTEQIDEIMGLRAGMGETWETYLVGPDKLMRSNSRFIKESTILKQKVDTKSVREALAGRAGTDCILNYREVPVLSAYMPLDIGGVRYAMLTEVNKAEAFASSRKLGRITMTIIGVVIVVVIGIGYTVAKRTSRPVIEITRAAEQVTGGDLNTRVIVKSRDEVGQLAQAFNQMVEQIQINSQKAEENAQRAEEALKNAEEARKKVEAQNEQLGRAVEEMLSISERVVEGDLSAHVEIEAEGEIGKLAKAINGMIDGLRSVIGQLRETSESVASAASQISSTSQEMAAGAEQQNSQVGEVTSAVEEMTATVMETAQNASKVAEAARGAQNAAQEGQEAVEQMAAGMSKINEVVGEATGRVERLGDSSGRIGEVVSTITEIADQTNLLALNAAIEAARAGEAGRGFAVVADEVRRLAERTMEATREIEGMIRQVQEEVNGVVEVMGDVRSSVEEGDELAGSVREAFGRIAGQVEVVRDMIGQIAAAAEEESKAVEEVSGNMEGIAGVASENAKGAQELARAAEDLSKLTAQLRNLVERFKV